MKLFPKTCVLTVILAFLVAAPIVCDRAFGGDDGHPDIVLIMADNLGHGDLSCYGCPDIKTPNIDSIAAAGVRFTNFYSNGPECSPTRTARTGNLSTMPCGFGV